MLVMATNALQFKDSWGATPVTEEAMRAQIDVVHFSGGPGRTSPMHRLQELRQPIWMENMKSWTMALAFMAGNAC